MENKDFLPLNGTDYLEFYVSNSLQAAKYYQTAFGFQPLAYSGLSTGNKKVESYVVQQGKIRLVFSSPLSSGSEIGKHIDKHGDGVKVIALLVENAKDALSETVKRGAEIVIDFESVQDENGVLNFVDTGVCVIESVFSLLALRDGIIPPTINLNNLDPECNLDFTPHIAREKKITTVMNNSFGFGGTNSSLVFKKV